MKKKTVFSIILALVFNLVFVPVVDARCVELKYDDGTQDNYIGPPLGTQYSVKFSLLQTAKLVKARFLISAYPNEFEVHVYDLDNNDLVTPFTVNPTSTGWFDVPLDIEVKGDFYIAIEWIVGFNNEPRLGYDDTLSQGRSYKRSQPTDPWSPETRNWMIRAVVCSPVGGELLPNTVSQMSALLTAGLTTTVIILVIVYNKRKLEVSHIQN